MRFLHTADIHLGVVPDRGMPWSEDRAKAVWDTFRTIIDIAGRQKVDLLLIAGDFFHRQPLRRECKEISYLFSTIPDTHVVIIAGNHDYIRDTSPYVTYPWNDNVTILSSDQMSSVYFEDINTEVHGLSYHSREIREPLYDHLKAPKDGRIHILLGHGGDEKHIPFRMHTLAEAGFSYVALGHIHQPELYEKGAVAYSGSPEPMDKTDVGQRGYILGTLSPGSSLYHWYRCASGEYQTLRLTVNRENTTSQIIDTLKQNLSADPRIIYRIVLDGFRDPDITFDTEQIMTAGKIVDVTDLTEPEYDLERLREEHAHDLVSHYIDRMDSEDPESPNRRALYYGLRALLNPEG